MNKKLGMYSSLVTLAAVLCFAVSMVFQSSFASYLSSLFISWGFVPMVCAFAAVSNKESKAVAHTAVAFAAVYAVIVGLVYFAQLTTVRLTHLTEQAAAILSYQTPGSLFFNYDLFGYGFMALATFFIGLTIHPNCTADRWLKALLLIHGVFAISGTLLPILGVFNAGMAGGDRIGVIVLEFWCLYFTPVCLLAYRYFRKLGPDSERC